MKYIVTIVHRESSHYEVEAASFEEAIEAAKRKWEMDEAQVTLGTEFVEVESAYVDEEEFAEVANLRCATCGAVVERDSVRAHMEAGHAAVFAVREGRDGEYSDAEIRDKWFF